MVSYLSETHPNWTTTNIVLLTILIEHILIIFKVIIQTLITDVPKSVIKAEKKRGVLEKKGSKFMKSFRADSSIKTYEELVDEGNVDEKILKEKSPFFKNVHINLDGISDERLAF